MPKISVIVPVYNVEPYIHRCVDSIIGQTLTDFELILVDDGSPDNCGAICDEYAKKDKRISVIHQDNKGVATARNIGVATARGEYIAFVDSDDWISERFLEELVNACIDDTIDVVLCDYALADSTTYTNPVIPIFDNICSGKEAVRHYALQNIEYDTCHFRAPWAKMVKKRILQKFPFPINRTYAEDAACVYLWLWNAQKVASIAEPLYYYYQNPNGACAKKIGLNVIGNFDTEREWIRFFKKMGETELCRLSAKRYLCDCVWAINGSEDGDDAIAANTYRRILRMGIVKYSFFAKIPLIRERRLLYTAFPCLEKIVQKIKNFFRSGFVCL